MLHMKFSLFIASVGLLKMDSLWLDQKQSFPVSIVKLFTNNRERLAEVQFFCKCKVKCSGFCKDIRFTAICFFPDKMMFGRPSEVWGGIADKHVYFPLSEFQNRVAFTKCWLIYWN